MVNIYVVFSVISYSLGFLVIVLSLLFFLKWKNRLFLFFSILMFSLTLTLFEDLIVAYVTKANISVYSICVIMGSEIIACAGIIFSVLNLYYGLLNISMDRKAKIIFGGTALSLIISLPVFFILQSFLFSMDALYSLILLLAKTANYTAIISFMFFSILILRRLDQIENIELRKYIRILAVLFCFFLPGLIIDSTVPLYDAIYTQWLHLPEGFAATDILYFISNLINIYFIGKFIIKKIKFVDELEIPYDFMKKYSITNREKEILSFILKNFSCSQIGRQLFISKRTVEKHLQNIYKKTNLNDRDQLASIINSNN